MSQNSGYYKKIADITDPRKLGKIGKYMAGAAMAAGAVSAISGGDPNFSAMCFRNAAIASGVAALAEGVSALKHRHTRSDRNR